MAPSLPGYGFSFRPDQPRFNVARIADVFATLMVDVLGYRRVAGHGDDWGAYISAQLGAAHAHHVVGIHVTAVIGTPRRHAHAADGRGASIRHRVGIGCAKSRGTG